MADELKMHARSAFHNRYSKKQKPALRLFTILNNDGAFSVFERRISAPTARTSMTFVMPAPILRGTTTLQYPLKHLGQPP